MKDVGGRIMATTTTISPPELVFPGHGPVCPSLKSTVSLSHRCREKVMRQPRVIYWVTLLCIVPPSALQGGPEKQLFIRTLLMRPATQIMMLQPGEPALQWRGVYGASIPLSLVSLSPSASFIIVTSFSGDFSLKFICM